MPADAGITIHESRLLRTFGAPAIVASIRNPRYRAPCSYRLFIVNDLKAAFYDHGKIMINAVPSLCSPIHL